MKWWIVLLLMLVIAPVVSAAPPFTQESGDVTAQLHITVPKNEYFLLNADATLHFHVFNSTGYAQTNETTDCFIHIYNETGAHVTELEMRFDSNLDEWACDLNSTDHTHTVGLVSYITWCNNTAEAGFFSSSFEVNSTTSLNRESVWPLALILVGLMFFFVYLSNVFKDNVKWFHQSIRLLLLILGMWLMVALGALGVAYANTFALSDSLLGVMQICYSLGVYTAWIFTFLLVLYYLYEVIMAFRWQKKEREEELLGGK